MLHAICAGCPPDLRGKDTTYCSSSTLSLLSALKSHGTSHTYGHRRVLRIIPQSDLRHCLRLRTRTYCVAASTALAVSYRCLHDDANFFRRVRVRRQIQSVSLSSRNFYLETTLPIVFTDAYKSFSSANFISFPCLSNSAGFFFRKDEKTKSTFRWRRSAFLCALTTTISRRAMFFPVIPTSLKHFRKFMLFGLLEPQNALLFEPRVAS